MERRSQVFRNGGDRPLIINLELATARYRLLAGEERVLHYDADDLANEHGAALVIETLVSDGVVEMVVWTNATTLHHPDGQEAELDFDPK